MRVCSFRHLTQAQIEPFSEQDVEQTDPVATWSPGSQMGKRICETKGCINFKQHVGNPNGRHSAIQIQYECLGTIRHVCCQPVDPQRSIFYATVRNSAVTGSPASRLRAIVSRAFLSASQSCGLEGTASFAFSAPRSSAPVPA